MLVAYFPLGLHMLFYFNALQIGRSRIGFMCRFGIRITTWFGSLAFIR